MAESPAAGRAFSGRTAWARSLETPLRRLPAHGDRQRGVPARRGGRGARLGQRRRRLVRARLADAALDPRRRLGRHARPAPLGEQRADDVLLLRHRPRGAARVRRGRPAPAAASRAADARRPRRDGRCPIGIYLAANAGHASAHGWGVAMSTDTAFALGMLALVGPRFPDRLRAFMLTVVVVDDVVALVVIATVYSEHVALDGAADRDRGLRRRRRRAQRRRALRARLRRCSARRPGWRSRSRASTRSSSGSSMGLLDVRVSGRRAATSSARPISSGSFREQPTPELERTARARAPVCDLAERAAAAALPPVDELRDRAALRARQRRHRDQRRLPLARVHVADHARHPRRLRRRQAGRDHRHVVARRRS